MWEDRVPFSRAPATACCVVLIHSPSEFNKTLGSFIVHAGVVAARRIRQVVQDSPMHLNASGPRLPPHACQQVDVFDERAFTDSTRNGVLEAEVKAVDNLTCLRVNVVAFTAGCSRPAPLVLIVLVVPAVLRQRPAL